MPYERDYAKEIDTLKQQIYNLQSENSRLIKEMNKLYDNLEELNKKPNSKVVLRKLKALDAVLKAPHVPTSSLLRLRRRLRSKRGNLAKLLGTDWSANGIF